MFLSKWFKRRVLVVPVPALGLDNLASRVSQRLRGVRTDNPMRTLMEIAAEEAKIDLDMAQFREMTVLREHIHALPPRQRAVLLDHVNDGLTYMQIARRRGMTERIVLRDLSRAYATLRMQMRSDDGRGDIQKPVSSAIAGLRNSPDDVGKSCGVRCSGEANGLVPSSAAVQRPDPSRKEG